MIRGAPPRTVAQSSERAPCAPNRKLKPAALGSPASDARFGGADGVGETRGVSRVAGAQILVGRRRVGVTLGGQLHHGPEDEHLGQQGAAVDPRHPRPLVRQDLDVSQVHGQDHAPRLVEVGESAFGPDVARRPPRPQILPMRVARLVEALAAPGAIGFFEAAFTDLPLDSRR